MTEQNKRAAGVLLHPSSLPGGAGIGDLGPAAMEFVRFLQDAGMRAWQILPLGPVNQTGSPYQTLSSYAGSPLLISLEELIDAGWLPADALNDCPEFSPTAVDYAGAWQYKARKLREAFNKFNETSDAAAARQEFAAFQAQEAAWLADYSLFAAAKEEFNGAPWWQWPATELQQAQTAAKATWREKLSAQVKFQAWLQFVFYQQWQALRQAANAAGIKIIGDLPIYTAHDSADVWAARQFFAVDPATGDAAKMAGAPPDYFSADGQLWGNPVYRWEVLKETGYAWWVERLKAALKQADILRLDHFRGFAGFWEVPAGEATARNGCWAPGPGQDFFNALRQALGDALPLIAEDLGVMTEDVYALRDDNKLPGMKILQFAFCAGANVYRPHNFPANCVVYTGTHDNDTTQGWYQASGDDYAHLDKESLARERDLARRYLSSNGENIHWEMIRLALGSVARWAIFPLQDILGLGNESRLNRPGTAEGNWRWRATATQLHRIDKNYLRSLITLFDRD